MNIIEAIKDPQLLGSFIGTDLASWQPWLAALRTLYGLPVVNRTARHIVADCTGRNVNTLPPGGFDAALFLTGRRSGKSRIAATVAAYEAVLAGHYTRLAPGERGVVPVVAPTMAQGRIVRDYCRAIFETPLFKRELERETKSGFSLRCGTRIEILAGDYRTIRGYTLLAAVVDEACFFGTDAETRSRTDTELMRAIRPALATTGGKLVCISSPYARKGWCWQQYVRHHANPKGQVLVWNASSRTMNPTLPEHVVVTALAEDKHAARSEYLGEWRDDVADYITRAVLDPLVIEGCSERMPRKGTKYTAFVDMSGGRGDDAALAIAHKEQQNVVIDYARSWSPPFNPSAVVDAMAVDLRRYGCRRVTGDNYAAEFVSSAFTRNGIRYKRAEQPKSGLYTELLPLLCSGCVELLDQAKLLDQLASLERRTRAGGKDIIDHPRGGHDDLANVVAGVAAVTSKPVRLVGAMF
ncbi:Terminase-like family protein [Roseimaritima multifibrata]|uniref:Terminase-like family protein n=1 Tax=Roseimaritima multifibrata TaxID=1930274 RepID=A0A517MAK1_9BACT|nr:hypothetical protein [Roseimaritima multifibrata]QDS91881.1 Terminase-like family protein [Roseimaritima multifibrata]